MPDRVLVDVRERESRLVDALHELGVETERRPLPIADYVAGDALVERKSVIDLHGSIIRGRFWPQLGRLRTARASRHLLVEGPDLDAGPLRSESVRGALLAVAELGVSVIRSTGPADSALWLAILATRKDRRPRNRPGYSQRPSSNRADEAMLAAVPGISTETAKALLTAFGSVEAIVAAGPEKWLSTRGVGPKRAQSLRETLQGRARHA